jgi:hypothetical protein
MNGILRRSRGGEEQLRTIQRCGRTGGGDGEPAKMLFFVLESYCIHRN